MYQICTEKDDNRCVHIKIHRNHACILLHGSPAFAIVTVVCRVKFWNHQSALMTWSLQLFFFGGGGFIFDTGTHRDNYEAQKTDGTNDDYAIFRYINHDTENSIERILSFRCLECHHSISSNQSPDLQRTCGATSRKAVAIPSASNTWDPPKVRNGSCNAKAKMWLACSRVD